VRMSRVRFRRFGHGSVLLVVLATAAHAQSYPDRPIRIVLAEAPGNANNTIARMLAAAMSSSIGTSVIVENRAGGGTLVGTRAVLDARPDGYTLLAAGSSPLIISALLNKNITYDLTKDITPIAGVGWTAWVLVASPRIPVKSVGELVAYAKANPGKLNIGYAQGSGPHLIAEAFKSMAGIDIIGVPYQGGPQVVTDLLGGSLQLFFGAPSTTLPSIESGALRALAVTGASRDDLLPDVPTMEEAGFPALTLTSTVGLIGPARMSPQVVQKIYQGVETSVRSPRLRDGLGKAGYKANLQAPPEYAELLKHYQQIWLPLAQAAGFSIR
jgi:tripartite-type tricarboxylate transporter receptor subunit TctC